MRKGRPKSDIQRTEKIGISLTPDELTNIGIQAAKESLPVAIFSRKVLIEYCRDSLLLQQHRESGLQEAQIRLRNPSPRINEAGAPIHITDSSPMVRKMLRNVSQEDTESDNPEVDPSDPSFFTVRTRGNSLAKDASNRSTKHLEDPGTLRPVSGELSYDDNLKARGRHVAARDAGPQPVPVKAPKVAKSQHSSKLLFMPKDRTLLAQRTWAVPDGAFSEHAYEIYGTTANFIWARDDDTLYTEIDDGASYDWTPFLNAGFCFSFRASAVDLLEDESPARRGKLFTSDPFISRCGKGTQKKAATNWKLIVVAFSSDILGNGTRISFAFREDFVKDWDNLSALYDLAYGKVYSAFNTPLEGTPEDQLEFFNWSPISLQDLGALFIHDENDPAQTQFDGSRFLPDSDNRPEWFSESGPSYSQDDLDNLKENTLSDSLIIKIVAEAVAEQLYHWNDIFRGNYVTKSIKL